MVADSALGASPVEPRPRGRQDEAILREYTRPVAFYVWATALPWVFWFAAAYLSHLPVQSQAVLVSTLVLSLAGLFSPLAVVVAFVWHRPRVRADIVARLKWPRADRLPWVLAAVLLVPVSLLVAQGLSLFFGYGLDQFSLRGGFTFSTGLMPAWATLMGPRSSRSWPGTVTARTLWCGRCESSPRRCSPLSSGPCGTCPCRSSTATTRTKWSNRVCSPLSTFPCP